MGDDMDQFDVLIGEFGPHTRVPFDHIVEVQARSRRGSYVVLTYNRKVRCHWNALEAAMRIRGLWPAEGADLHPAPESPAVLSSHAPCQAREAPGPAKEDEAPLPRG